MDVIQWYPGHMAKAMRKMEESVKLVDGGCIVLDARCPYACENRKIEKLFGTKPILFVLNKADLVDKNDLTRLTAEYIKNKRNVIAIDSRSKRDIKALYDKIFSILKEKIEANRQKGYFRPVRIMVAGIPNTGKSTIINALAGGKKAQVGDKAGVTRSNQWIKLEELELLDTPGTMPPSFSDQQSALRLAFIGSVNDEILDSADLCFELIKFLAEKYHENLKERYKLDNLSEAPLENFEAICKARGYIKKGAEYDYDRCAKAVIDDLRSGKLGKIVFE